VLPGLMTRARFRGLEREWRTHGSPAVGGERPPYRLSIAFVRNADTILPALDALHQEICSAEGRTKTFDTQIAGATEGTCANPAIGPAPTGRVRQQVRFECSDLAQQSVAGHPSVGLLHSAQGS
jgi:hypothetical protein